MKAKYTYLPKYINRIKQLQKQYNFNDNIFFFIYLRIF